MGAVVFIDSALESLLQKHHRENSVPLGWCLDDRTSGSKLNQVQTQSESVFTLLFQELLPFLFPKSLREMLLLPISIAPPQDL